MKQVLATAADGDVVLYQRLMVAMYGGDGDEEEE